MFDIALQDNKYNQIKQLQGFYQVNSNDIAQQGNKYNQIKQLQGFYQVNSKKLNGLI